MSHPAEPMREAKGQHAISAEHLLADLWREVLHVDETPKGDDNFFALGGDSMAMVTLEFRIQEETGISLPPGALLAAPTLRQLTALVSHELLPNAGGSGRTK